MEGGARIQRYAPCERCFLRASIAYMSTTRPPGHSIATDTYSGGPAAPSDTPPERRLALSGMIRRRLTSANERERQRSRVVNVLILAQVLLSVAIAIGNVGTPNAIVILSITGGAALIYIVALVTNQVFHHTSAAAYMLVIGGALATAASPVLPAIMGQPAQASQASLLFTAVILEAGLLFSPEVTLIIATAVSVFTAFALLFSIAVSPQTDRHATYLLIVTTLGLDALSALIAWLISTFIFDTTFEAQRVEELQFAQARLDALQASMYDHERSLDQAIRAIQQAVTRVLSGEYNVRAELPGGPLKSLEDSLNLLLDQARAAGDAEQVRARVEAAALPLIDAVTRMTDAGSLTPLSVPIMTNTALDGLSVVLSQMQAQIAQRMARIQRIAGDLVGAIDHSQDSLNDITEELQEAGRITGALVASAEAMKLTIRKELEVMLQLRRIVGAVVPDAAQSEMTRLGPTEAAAWLGLGPDLGLTNSGLTGEFETLGSGEPIEVSDIGSLTVPLQALDPSASSSEIHASGQADDAEKGNQSLDPALAKEIWRLLEDLTVEIKSLDTLATQIARDLGIQTRHQRQADANIAWFHHANDAIRSGTEQLQQVVGASTPPPGPGEPAPASPSRPLENNVMRPPQRTRPLAREHEGLGRAELDAIDKLTAEENDLPAPGTLRASDLVSLDEGNPPETE